MKISYVILIIISISILLIGCNTSIDNRLNEFCNSKGLDKMLSIRDYNYKNTKIECANCGWLLCKDTRIFNISCTTNQTCLKLDRWGDCNKKYYNYECFELEQE